MFKQPVELVGSGLFGVKVVSPGQAAAVSCKPDIPHSFPVTFGVDLSLSVAQPPDRNAKVTASGGGGPLAVGGNGRSEHHVVVACEDRQLLPGIDMVDDGGKRRSR